MTQHPDYIQIGSCVVVESASGEADTYFVVNPREADPRAGRVSSESPIGRALLGRRVGERVVIVAPGGSFAVTIQQVSSPESQVPGL
jgi:transcription elongation factor GreA